MKFQKTNPHAPTLPSVHSFQNWKSLADLPMLIGNGGAEPRPPKNEDSPDSSHQAPKSNPGAARKHGKSLNVNEVGALTGCKRATVWNRINPRSKQYCPDWPRPAYEGRLAKWSEREVELYLERRLAKRDALGSSK